MCHYFQTQSFGSHLKQQSATTKHSLSTDWMVIGNSWHLFYKVRVRNAPNYIKSHSSEMRAALRQQGDGHHSESRDGKSICQETPYTRLPAQEIPDLFSDPHIQIPPRTKALHIGKDCVVHLHSEVLEFPCLLIYPNSSITTGAHCSSREGTGPVSKSDICLEVKYLRT